MASIGPGLEQEYGRAFPYGDYTYGQDPEQSLNRLSSSDRELRNRFMLYERMAQGQTPVNMNVITPAQQYGPWNYVKDTVSNLFSGTPAAHMTGALLDYQGVPVSGPEDIRVGTDYHTDVLRRIGNRWGGDFQLSYPNDRALDWASYSAEAAPIFLSAGASAAPQTVGTGGGFLVRGFSPFAQRSSSALARYAGRAIPQLANFSYSSLNPVPIIMGMAGTSGLARAASAAYALMGARGAVNNYADAARDVSNMAQVYPDSTLGERARQFGSSALDRGFVADAGVLAPYRLGASWLTQPGAALHESRVAPLVDAAERSIMSNDENMVRQFSESGMVPPMNQETGYPMSLPAWYAMSPTVQQALRQTAEDQVSSAYPALGYAAKADKAVTLPVGRWLGGRDFSTTFANDQRASALINALMQELPDRSLQDVARVPEGSDLAMGALSGSGAISDRIRSYLESMSPAGRRSLMSAMAQRQAPSAIGE